MPSKRNQQRSKRSDIYDSQLASRRAETETQHGAKGNLEGVTITGYSIGQWCSSPDGSGKPEAVAISIETDVFPPMYMRLFSRQAVDQFLQVMEEHRDEVFPEDDKS